MELNKENNFSLKKTINLYKKKWIWFVLSCIICVGIAYLYIRYSVPQYSSTAKIMLVSENDKSSPGAALSDLSPLANTSNAETGDEILVFTSKAVINNVV